MEQISLVAYNFTHFWNIFPKTSVVSFLAGDACSSVVECMHENLDSISTPHMSGVAHANNPWTQDVELREPEVLCHCLLSSNYMNQAWKT